MRLALAIVAAIPFVQSARAADVPLESRIDSVTVFPSGAEVSRTAKVQLEKGEATLVLSDVAAEAVPGSIRVEGKATGQLAINSVDSRRLLVTRADAPAAESERRRLEEEAERLKDEKSALEAAVLAADTQKSLIANLTNLPSRPAPAAADGAREDWRQILATIQQGTADAARSSLEAEIKIREIDRKLEDVEKRLAALAPARIEQTEVRVYVEALAPLDADIIVRYQVPSASWTPLYDARLSSGDKTTPPALELTRRASIAQTSGESWDDVAITLSTTRPSAGASAPELDTVTVDFEPEMRPRTMAPMAGAGRSLSTEEDMAAAEPVAEAAPPPAPTLRKAAAMEREATVVAAPFQAVYAVPGRLTIPNTGEAKKVRLLADLLEPQLSVKTVPKADARAYLYAKLELPKGASPMLPGPVALFRDGTFVGTSKLPVLSPGEEHELGFGIDDLVRVKHAIAEEKRGETGLISTSRIDSRNYKLTVKNLHERAIQLVVFDQMPVSANSDIRVELTSRTGPTRQNVDDKRGVLAWDLKLEPDQEQTIEFGYRVTWPSGKQIIYR